MYLCFQLFAQIQSANPFAQGQHRRRENGQFIQFHFGIVRISRNSILANVYENLLPLLEITRQFTVTKNGILYNTILAHNAIYDRIAAQDAEGAQMCMTEHMQGTKDLLEERLKGLNSEQVARQFSVHSVQLEPHLPPFQDTSST